MIRRSHLTTQLFGSKENSVSNTENVCINTDKHFVLR